VSNYASYQQKFEADYRTVTQQPTNYFNQASTYVYKPEQQAGFGPNPTNYPFAKNIELASSDYTYIDNKKSFAVG
jgi:hypothetical protein